MMSLAYFWHVIHGCLYNQALADIRLIAAGIKCLQYLTLDKQYFQGNASIQYGIIQGVVKKSYLKVPV